MVAVLEIPKTGDQESEEKLCKLMHLVFEMVDAIANVSYSSTV